MPEIAEVAISSQFVNRFSDRNFTLLRKSDVSKVKTDLTLAFDSFSISSVARGKEMKILLSGEKETKSLKITLGMSGGWIFYDPSDTEHSKYHKHAHLQFHTDDGHVLALHDVRRFAKWSWSDFDPRRGPCPLTQPEEFRREVLLNWQTHRSFRRPIHLVMMDQGWFNGVGNYLRAEILYRAKVNPFGLASDLSDLKMGHVLEHTIICANQALALGGGQLKDWKNPTGENPADFREWIKCYGKSQSIIDETGRRFWYDESRFSPGTGETSLSQGGGITSDDKDEQKG